jgi:hypothetical protein
VNSSGWRSGRRHVDDAGRASRASWRSSWSSVRLDLTLQSAADVEIGARAQFLRDEVARAVAHAFLDVVARDDEVLPVVGRRARSCGRGDVGVPVIDGDPIERVPRSFSIWLTRSRVKVLRSAISTASSGETMKRK